MKKVYFILLLLWLCIRPSGMLSLAADNVSSDTFKIPEQLGSVTERSGASSRSASFNPLIIHIQDAHCNYEAQKNMALILEHLVKEYGLKLIMVEGGSGDVGLSFLRDNADKEKRLQVAEDYLRRGEISGEEYLDITSDHDLELYGVEDAALYEKNLETFLELDTCREQGLEDLKSLEAVADELKGRIYNSALRKFIRTRQRYADQEINLADFCLYLFSAGRENALDLSGHINFNAFVRSADLEATLDFDKALMERNEFIRELSGYLSKDEFQKLLEKADLTKQGEISQLDFYTFLKKTAEGVIDLSARYPQLAGYMEYIDLGRKINAPALSRELIEVENLVKRGLCRSRDESELCEITGRIGLLSRFLRIELSPDEYASFHKEKDMCRTFSWVPFLREKCEEYGMSRFPRASAVIDQNLDRLDKFYTLGISREKAFFVNLDEKMNESGERLAVLITGGFHTPGVTRMMKDRGYSYVVVVPMVTGDDDPDLYFSILKGADNKEQ